MRRVLRVPLLTPPSASEALRALVLARLVACEALRIHFFVSLGAYGASRWNPSLVGYRLIYAVLGLHRW